ncbi:MAG: SMP-30/gluconolactonase/LRE family protein [Saprospiraceae bacterium]|nr:SMP-30/gluconolactonase/LRE family protein [Saprospiraceae bacterium]
MKYLFLLAGMFYYQLLYPQQVLMFEDQLNLVPEGIAIHPGNGTIYISSIAKKKIIRIMPNGTTANLFPEGQDNFLEGLGMKVDTKRGLLWALSNSRRGNEFTSQIHAFDLTSGKTMHQYKITDTIPRLFNDLVIDKSGSLLITDTYLSSIYKYDPALKDLDVLVHDTSKIKWPNGIELLDENTLAIATYGSGIMRVNIRSKEVSILSGYKDRSIAFGLDGLVLIGNSLYGVYNAGEEGYATNAVIKYTLDAQKRQIILEEVIDKGNPSFADPTTAATFSNKLYVIANSHLSQYNANKETVAGIENALTPLQLVWYEL